MSNLQALPKKKPPAKVVIMLVRGGDGLNLFETRPLQDILADIADGWNTTQLNLDRLKVKATQETVYVL